MFGTRAVLLAAPFLLASGPTIPAAPQRDVHVTRVSSKDQFRIGRNARAQLRALWTSSTGAKAERVACIGGTVVAGIAHISKVQQLDAPTTDSTHILAEESMRSCRPPEWLGTAHTHIASFSGQPFVTFSPDDRNVIWLWHKQWKETGVFCVLYNDHAAHCESGEELSGDPNYSDDVDDEEAGDGHGNS